MHVCVYNVIRSCQPTYEELKQYIQDHITIGLVSCQPTYEELKQCLEEGILDGADLLPAYL